MGNVSIDIIILEIKVEKNFKYSLIYFKIKNNTIVSVNTNFIFKNYIFQTNQFSEKNSIVLYFCRLFWMSGVMSSHLDSSLYSAFSLWQYITPYEICEENSASQRHLVGNGRSILIAFSGDCEYSSFILYQHSTCDTSLKDSGNVGSKTT